MPRQPNKRRVVEDVALAKAAGLLADESRARILLTLGDGRALPASVLAREAGVSASTVSSHLAKLLETRLLLVEQYGRFRYFRLSDPCVADGLEALAGLAERMLARSGKTTMRERALRNARTCYNHLAGKLGVALMNALLESRAIVGHDGTFHPAKAVRDRLSAPGQDYRYELTSDGTKTLHEIGVPIGDSFTSCRYCVDWSEQRHHLSGPLGAAIQRRFLELGWVKRSSVGRIINVTHEGIVGLQRTLGIVWPPQEQETPRLAALVRERPTQSDLHAARRAFFADHHPIK
jgi:DNA-binding transcriptional ArsR family regulator